MIINILKFITLALAIAYTVALVGKMYYKNDIEDINVIMPGVFISAFVMLQFII